ncbi:beta-ketoacyl synthase N-terminal-like domain-containing protein [Kitasatospora sp. NPDC057541]|uniref:type I polyketide synthase n=1 Tax=unclassified Kitasatospora TaxID=2633591 RepID=UPI003693E269
MATIPFSGRPESGAEPVAVIGMGCRLPGGVDSPEQLWQLLVNGQDAIGQVPAERWEHYEKLDPRNAAALRSTTSQGGFLADAAAFDAEFFGVTPREAELMDPQQRIVLEVAWEALENAGLPPHTLAGTDAAVFMGVGSDDYGRQMLEDLPAIEAWSGIGASMCAVANRISYALDLRGPSLIADTACSSSIVALHLACQSLRTGEATLAIAGGVNVMAGPGLTMVLDAAGATSSDGRSKSFDAAADGYGRGEGAGVLVLKLLSEAQRDGDRILAVLRGTAVNQDGRTAGIMAPNGEAQEYVARQALRQAGVAAQSVGYVEAHGTGTRKGDPIEVGALSRVFGENRGPDDPCLIGTVKPTIGHLEAGAGVAGVIKAVLALVHGRIPATPNITELNPDIPWETSGLRVVTETTEWPGGEGPRRAGVSSFGYGGTVAHAVLEQAPTPAAGRSATAEPFDGERVFALSGVTEAGLRANAAKLADWLTGAGSEAAQADVAHTLLHRRSHLGRRAAVVAADRAGLVEALRKTAAGEPDRAVVEGAASSGPARDAVWLFSGHGSQWLGMGRELLETDAGFAAAIDEVEAIYRAEMGFSPRRVLLEGPLDETHVIQPMIFAVQIGLAAALEARGVRPAAVIGHSVGEIAAAVVAGVFSREDGARLICRRSALLREVAGLGAMALVDLAFDEADRELAGTPDAVAAIAASPGSTVVAGTPQAVAAHAERWRAAGRTVREVASDVAFHSPQMDPLLDRLVAAVADLVPAAPRIPVYSTALADPRSTTVRDGHYWSANLRNAVRLDRAVAAAAEDGHRLFLEVSAHPVIVHSVKEALAEAGHDDAFTTGTLRRNQPEAPALLLAVGALHAHGAAVDLTALQPDGTLVDLPTTAWQHKRFWRTPSTPAGSGSGRHRIESSTLLGGRLTLAGDSSVRLWQTYLDHGNRPYPGSHPIHGVEVVPAAVLISTFAAASEHGALTDVDLRVPVAVTGPRDIQVVAQDGMVRLASRPTGDGAEDDEGLGWTSHATARAVAPAAAAAVPDLAAARARCTEALRPEAVVEHLHRVGVADVGFDWRIVSLDRGERELIARVAPAGDGEGRSDAWASLLDAILSFAPLLFEGEPTLRMPARIGRVEMPGRLGGQTTVHVRLTDAPDGDTVEAVVVEDDGTVSGRLGELRFGKLDGDAGAAVSPRRLVHRLAWEPVESEPEGGARLRAVGLLGGSPRARAAIAAAFEAERVRPVAVADLDGLPAAMDELGPDDALLVLPVAEVPEGDIAGTAVDNAWQLARTAQLLAQEYGAPAPRLWGVTVGARESTALTDLAQGPLWGLGRIIAGEQPELWAGLVDLDPTAADLGAGQLADLVRTRPEPDVFAVRDGAVLAARLAELSAEPDRAPLNCRADSTYLITGGLGTLGTEVATWLAGRGARRIVLAGRSGLPPRHRWDAQTEPETVRRITAVRDLEALGVTVRVLELDITDQAAAKILTEPEALGLPPIRGIVHAAGVLDNRMLHGLTRRSLADVMRPKVEGALVLDGLFPAGTLDFFALFSSIGLQLGLTGQASYASANSFLDAFARHRAAAGAGDTVSLGWTSWRAMGMAVNKVVDAELADRGVGDISVTDAFRAWEFASSYQEPYLAVLRTVRLPEGTGPLPILSGLGELGRAAGGGQDGDPAEEFGAGLAPEPLRELLVTEVGRQVGGELRVSLEELDVNRALTEMGLDSVMTMTVRRSLEKRFRLSLPATLLWNHPSVTSVAGYLAERLIEQRSAAAEANEPEPATETAQEQQPEQEQQPVEAVAA